MKTKFFVKSIFLITLLTTLAGSKVQAADTFTATYYDGDGRDQINATNLLTFYWNYKSSDSSWTWAIFGYQGNWYYCNYAGNDWGQITPITDDGTNLTFSTAQFGGVSPDSVFTGYSYNQLTFAENASSVSINLDLDADHDLNTNAITILSTTAQIAGNPVQPSLLLTAQLMNSGDMRLSFEGAAETAYVLERTASLSSPDWVAQTTNTTDLNGLVIFTNTPDITKNNFWRVRSAQ